MHRFTAWIETHKGESIGIAIGLIGLIVVLFLARRGGSGAPGQTPAFVFPGGGGGGGSADGGGPGSPGSTGGTAPLPPGQTLAPGSTATVDSAGNTIINGGPGGGVTSYNPNTGQIIAGFGPKPNGGINTDVLAPFSGSAGSSSRVGAPQSN